MRPQLRAAIAILAVAAAAVGAQAQCTDVREGPYFGPLNGMDAFIVLCWPVAYDAGTVFTDSTGAPITLAEIPLNATVRATGCVFNSFWLQAETVQVLTPIQRECTETTSGLLFAHDPDAMTLNVNCWPVHYTGSTVFEDSNGSSILPGDIPVFDEVTVTGCAEDDFTITANKVVWNRAPFTTLDSTFDDAVVLGSNGASSYFVQSTTDPGVAATGTPNPALTLQIGKRYMFSFANPAAHPFALVRRGATPAADQVLLVQGAGAGSLEGDAAIGWTDNGADFFFTLTQELADAMNGAPSADAGYRCNIHSGAMRGTITTVGAASVGTGWMIYH
ncbi:MAG: DUF5666 domain-containing protein [Candidatus Sumerlaeia bacterium]|nr:DUF5666 domain-containing protein [Candidatus Sumerlaeia bacterium]